MPTPDGGLRQVCRIGALALTLGISTAISAGSAWADDATTSATKDSGPERTDSTASRSTSPRAATSTTPNRRDARSASADGPGRPNAGSGIEQLSNKGIRARRAASTEVSAESARGTADDGPDLDSVVSAGSTLPAATTQYIPTPPKPVAALAAAVAPPSVAVTETSRQEPSTIAIAATPATGQPMAASSAVTGQPVAAKSTVSGSPVHRLAALAREALTALFGTGPAWGPDSPLSWALLGWTRRQSSAAVTEAVAAPAQSTALPLPAHAEHPPGLPEELERVTLVAGLVEPTDFRFLPNGAILITEKSGSIRVFQDNHLQHDPLITLNGRTEVERGLSGIAVDPDFAENHYVYVSYTGPDNHQLMSRLTVDGYTGDQTTDVLSAGSEQILYRVDDQAANYHQGGGITFGPDGNLYWGLGDNFDFRNSQDLSLPHGKILRLDVHTLNADGTASVPADNPFVNTPGALPEIYAYGFRNPFRFTFTPTGHLLEADVGGAAWEEVNVVRPGANYGWPLAEGVCEGCGFANPIYAYPHTAPPLVAGAISSILVYTGDSLGSEYTNKVFIADYALNWIRTLEFDSEYESFISEDLFDDSAGTTVQLLEGADGKIYQLSIYPGTLSVIGPTDGNRAPTAAVTAAPVNGYAPLSVEFSSEGSSDPDGDTLSYAWDFGDPSTDADVSTEANPSWQYSANGSYTATLVVSDGEKTGQASQSVVVGSTAPTATILTPVADAPYSAGDTISFSGEATDAEDGALPDSAYSWKVVFHHGDHVHPFADNIAGPSGTITIPTDESNVSNTWYRFVLTVTDSTGLSTSTYSDVKPRLVNLTFTSSDPDAVYTIDGIPHRGTYTEQAVVGVKRILDVPSPQQTANNGVLVFGAWSDAGTQKHAITTPGVDTTYTVVFDDGNPHYVPPTGSLIGRFADNQAATLRHLSDAVGSAGLTLWETAVELAFSSLNEAATVTGPDQIPGLLSMLGTMAAGGLAHAVATVTDALTDVVATTVTRVIGVGAAVAANTAPLLLTAINIPVAIATALADGVSLFVTYLQAWDNLGIQASLTYIPKLIGQAMAVQGERLLGAVNDLRDDVLTALLVDMPGAAPSPAGNSATDPLEPLQRSLTRSADIFNDVAEISGSLGQALDQAVRNTLSAAASGIQSVGVAVTSGQPVGPPAIVSWRSVLRQAGAGRLGVHDAIDAAGKALGDPDSVL